MRIAVSAREPSLDTEVDPRFGRCQYFIIVNPENMEFEIVKNSGPSTGGGAGIATAQMIANKSVGVVLTDNCGPNAFQVLSAAGIKVITGVSGKVKNTVQDYKTNSLQPASKPNVPGHFVMEMDYGSGHK